MRTPILATLALAGTLLAAACGDSARPDAAVVTRDSAGIAIIENAAPASDVAPFTVDSAPIIELGGRGTHEEFSGFVLPLRLSDGRIAVANSGTNEIRVFSAEGEWRQNMGRLGRGPGEFESLAWLDAGVGDTLRAYDWELQRITVFAPDGAVQRSMRLGGRDQVLSHSIVGALDDGSIVARRSGNLWMGTRELTGRDTALLFRFDAEGSLAESLGRFPANEVLIERTETSESVGPLPFGKDLYVAAHAGRFFVGTADAPAFTVLRPDGSVERIVRWTASSSPIATEVIERYVESIRASWPSSDAADRDASLARLRAAPFPRFKPAYEGLLVSVDGYAWVRRTADPGTASVVHDVFDPDGRWLGAVTLPARFAPHQITADEVVGVWRDADDVQHVRVYPLRAHHSQTQG